MNRRSRSLVDPGSLEVLYHFILVHDLQLFWFQSFVKQRCDLKMVIRRLRNTLGHGSREDE